MCAYRTVSTFEARGIRPPPRDSVTVGESDLKFIHLRNGNDARLLEYVRGGGIAFPHIMIPEALQLRATKTTGSSGGHGSPEAASNIIRRPPAAGNEDDERSVWHSSKDSAPLLTTIVSHALWLWNAKQHISELSTQLQTQSLLLAESWLPAPLGHLIFNRVAGTAAAAEVDAKEAAEAEGLRNMLAKTDGPVGCVAWHPHRSLVAISHRATDCIFLYDLSADAWCPNVLQNSYMQGITSMAWQPNAGYTLAAGCTAGVCMWNIFSGSGTSTEPEDQSRAPSLGAAGQFSSWMTLLSFPSFSGPSQYPSKMEPGTSLHRTASSVSALTFSNSGQWLVTGHQTHGHLTVWDTALGTGTPLKRSGNSARSATLGVQISPNDQYLVSTHADGQLRLWETEGWASRVWSDFKSPITQFTWAPDSRSVFFSIADSSDIYALALYKTPPSLEAEVTVVSSFESHTAAVQVDGEDGEEGEERIRVGGTIKLLTMDPKGQRLVVGFDDDDSTSADISVLAVYLVNTDALFRAGGDSSALMPLGYVRGPDWGKQHQLERSVSAESSALKTAGKAATSRKKRVRVGTPTPSWVGFMPNFEPGALLTVAWANGKVSLVPMLFDASRLSKV
ncbi:hypothetical protein GGF46_004580 [Coemansia sp. RSA 552]|nr:hypothetical protein GGF46_004580 [Coemansia sp. RSA 552]